MATRQTYQHTHVAANGTASTVSAQEADDSLNERELRERLAAALAALNTAYGDLDPVAGGTWAALNATQRTERLRQITRTNVRVLRALVRLSLGQLDAVEAD